MLSFKTNINMGFTINWMSGKGQRWGQDEAGGIKETPVWGQTGA
jgi:hypothetical protein